MNVPAGRFTLATRMDWAGAGGGAGAVICCGRLAMIQLRAKKAVPAAISKAARMRITLRAFMESFSDESQDDDGHPAERDGDPIGKLGGRSRWSRRLADRGCVGRRRRPVR